MRWDRLPVPRPGSSPHARMAQHGAAIPAINDSQGQLAKDSGDTGLGSSLRLCSEGQDSFQHRDTYSYKRCQLRGDRERFGTRDGVRDDEVGLGCGQRAGHNGAIAAGSHLLHQLYGALRDLVGIRAGLLPQRQLLRQHLLPLQEENEV